MPEHDKHKAVPAVLVTGPSGAGRTTAINVLEDLGFEAIDNLPLRLLPGAVLDAAAAPRPMALGLDSRNRDFSPRALLDCDRHAVRPPRAGPDRALPRLPSDVLLRRYSETRRRHPLAPMPNPRAKGVRRELDLMATDPRPGRHRCWTPRA